MLRVLVAALLLFAFLIPGSVRQSQAAPSLPGLRVAGNRIVDSAGQPVQLRGVNRSGTQYACVEGWGIFDGPVDDTAIRAMAAWHINAVRVSLNEHCWLGINGAPAATSGAAYQNAIADFVMRLNAYGMYVILDLHWNAPGRQLARGQQAMADRDHSPAFWRQVAARFKDNGAVLFDLYNEPHPDSERDSAEAWRCWRDGGTCAGVSFQVAGMQEMVDAVRSTGAQNVVIANGVRWGNRLTRWLEYRPTDPTGNLAAGWHSYHDGLAECDDSTTPCLDAKLGAVVQQVPIVATEIGQFDCRSTHIEAVMTWLDRHGQNYTAWSWMPSGCTAEPALIADWNGTPTRTYGQGFKDHLARVGSNPPPPPSPTPPTSGATTWYFAEGYTAEGFDEYLTIQNVSNQAGMARITYFPEGAAPVIRSVQLPANSRTTVQVHTPASAGNPGGYGRTAAGQGMAAKVETTVPTVVERPMYFTYGNGITDGHNVMGARAPQQVWYFAEGYTGPGFDEYLTIQNPNASPAPVTITYYFDSGATVTKQLTVAPTSRATVAVHDEQAGVGRNQAVSAKVETTNPGGIVVERPMYFTYNGSITGGHNVLGARAPQTRWYFAEGYTGTGFDQYLTIMNPSPTDARLRLTYYLASGAPLVKDLTARGHARTTVAVHDPRDGVGRGQAVSTLVESVNDIGVVVERPMYFTYNGSITGGHNVMGTSTPRTTWYFAEGYTGAGFDEYLTIQNPSGTAAVVRITYYLASGAPIVKTLTAPANARTTVAVHDSELGVGRGQAVSAKVESTNEVDIVVERPMYFTYSGAITGGHNVMGYAP